MKLLVTGGAGYIGQSTCALLHKKGHDITVIDDERNGDLGSLPASIRKFRFDCGDPEAFARALHETPRIDGLIHLAATADVAYCECHPDIARTQNVELTRLVVEECRKRAVDRLVMASTCLVYGEGRENEPIVESLERRPMSTYAQTKSDAEDIVTEQSCKHNLRATILRYFFVSGVDSTPSARLRPNFVSEVVRRGISGETLPTFYDPSMPEGPIRDYVSVADVAAANAAALESSEDSSSQVLNVGSGTSFSLSALVSEATKLLGQPIKVAPAAPPKNLGRYLVANTHAVRRELGWTAKINLPEILKSLRDWLAKEPTREHNT